MSHKISIVEIKNYKSIVNAVLKLSSFTPLVGYNNAGKSNCLSAIQWILKKSSLTNKDFFDSSLPVEVTATVNGVSQALLDLMPARQKSSIEKYVQNETLRIRRIQETPNARVAEIRISVWDASVNDWAVNPTGLDNALGVLLPEPIRIGAMENAAEDASRAKTSTTIGKLLGEFLTPVKTAHEADLNQHLNEVGRRISSDGDMRFSELSIIDQNVNSKVNNLFPGMSVKLHFDTPTIDDLIKAGTLKVFEGAGDGRDFSSYGHGAQRSIQMALVQYLAEIKRSNNSSAATTLLLIDEPELYLHPFAIEQVREALIALSLSGYQVVISTHSAQMITPELAEHTLLIRKSDVLGTHARLRLADAIQSVVPNSTHQMEQLFNLAHSSQLLFAENVVLTEGKTELRLLPFLFKNITSLTMGQEKHALVAQSGVNDTKKSLEILTAMDLPSKAICDLDYCFTGAVRDGFLLSTDQDLLSLKALLQNLVQSHGVTLNGNGLPKNSNTITAAGAFEVLANVQAAIPLIESLHTKMKAQNIWVWKKGAIEAHIGTPNKTESAWAQFKSDVMTNGLSHTCSDPQSLLDLVEWLRN
ncbi:ATP-dependent nuclease [Pseudoalteromonas shioyasakiensis]|uniref:ATP-dependent nuclease n=1 Tax=Pseudoalteromonas shioyasakiensis TaxID=1190813 RepID=UPI0022B11F8F|nr:AAA family ATPase [Pseudoalteromonas shioyasakiensis]MCZ4251456.1 AAA family ATPase [Pseudoalteromonas shioyasakiensis]